MGAGRDRMTRFGPVPSRSETASGREWKSDDQSGRGGKQSRRGERKRVHRCSPWDSDRGQHGMPLRSALRRSASHNGRHWYARDTPSCRGNWYSAIPDRPSCWRSEFASAPCGDEVCAARDWQKDGARPALRTVYFERVKSALPVPETSTDLRSVFMPSCQATTLYLPSGTFWIL